MSSIKIEFFHDVICSFCFPMSYRMRQLQAALPQVEIIHRSFALVRSEQDFNAMFGSRANAKAEILGHWAHANAQDDLHRFNIEGMQRADFPFPTSMNPLLACKAAYFAAGQGGYWDVFDALQEALFVQSRNVESEEVIRDCVLGAGIPFAQWEQHYHSGETKNAVEQDLLLAQQYGIDVVPSLIINGKYRISGAQPLAKMMQAVDAALANVGEQPSGAACRLADGAFQCE